MKVLTARQELLWKNLLTAHSRLNLECQFPLLWMSTVLAFACGGFHKCDGNSVLIEIRQGADNVQQMLPNSA